MAFFPKRKDEEVFKDVEEIKKALQKEPLPAEKSKVEETILEEQPQKEPEKQVFVPLFVKIERYREVLEFLKDLKSSVIAVKNAMIVQKEIEALSNENRAMIEAAINKIDEKILALDSEFTRPKGYKEGALAPPSADMALKPSAPPTPQESKNLENVVDELKSQIDNLKSLLKQIS